MLMQYLFKKNITYQGIHKTTLWVYHRNHPQADKHLNYQQWDHNDGLSLGLLQQNLKLNKWIFSLEFDRTTAHS